MRVRSEVELPGTDSESHGDSPQPCITGPHDVGFVHGRPEEVGVDEPDATTMKPPSVDEGEDLVVLGLPRPRQCMKQFQDHVPTREGTTGDFADHKRMADNFTRLQDRGQLAIAPPQVVDPDRCVDEDHRRHQSVRPASRGHSGPAIRATEGDELFGRLARDQRLEAHADEFGLPVDAGEPGGDGERFLVDVERGSHAYNFHKSYAFVKWGQGPGDGTAGTERHPGT
jgi:hypothetical protein